jgi:hypothetical protein
MSSAELKLQNATRRQELIEQTNNPQLAAPSTPREIQKLTLAVVEIGQLIAEQLCELREAVERATPAQNGSAQ